MTYERPKRQKIKDEGLYTCWMYEANVMDKWHAQEMADLKAEVLPVLRNLRVGCATAEQQAMERHGTNWRNIILDALIAKLEGE